MSQYFFSPPADWHRLHLMMASLDNLTELIERIILSTDTTIEDMQRFSSHVQAQTSHEDILFELLVTLVNQSRRRRRNWNLKNVESLLECVLMKLPSRIVLRKLRIAIVRSHSYSVIIKSRQQEGFIFPKIIDRKKVLEKLLRILLICNCAAQKVMSVSLVTRSTRRLLVSMMKKEREYRASSMSLRCISIDNIRKKLPFPADEEVLKATGLPKTLYRCLTPEDVVRKIMKSLSQDWFYKELGKFSRGVLNEKMVLVHWTSISKLLLVLTTRMIPVQNF